MRPVKLLLVLVVGFFLVSCSHVPKHTKRMLEKDISCNAADLDIEILEGAKASTAKRTMSGVKSVVPTSVVINLLKGTYKDGISVTTGQLNEDIDAKIMEIQRVCNTAGE